MAQFVGFRFSAAGGSVFRCQRRLWPRACSLIGKESSVLRFRRVGLCADLYRRARRPALLLENGSEIYVVSHEGTEVTSPDTCHLKPPIYKARANIDNKLPMWRR